LPISLAEALVRLGLGVASEDRCRPITVDQTNESWIVDEAVVVKLLIDDDDVPHAAADRLRRLAAAGFVGTPRLVGVVEGGTVGSAVAIATEYIPGAQDGWQWCVDEAKAALGVVHAEEHPFATDLGALTAGMHHALRDADGLVAVHGDFHVGQVLRTPTRRLYVIDFDGNPTLPPEQRMLHRPAAYDVANMLLSLENVGHVVHKHHPEVTDEDAAAWSATRQDEFLTAYRGVAEDLLDASLLEQMTMEQIQREFDYAERHLPRWKYVPEAALRRRGLRRDEL
jgi:maltokinase